MCPSIYHTPLSTYLQSEVKGLHLTQQNNPSKWNPSDPDFAQHAPDGLIGSSSTGSPTLFYQTPVMANMATKGFFASLLISVPVTALCLSV